MSIEQFSNSSIQSGIYQNREEKGGKTATLFGGNLDLADLKKKEVAEEKARIKARFEEAASHPAVFSKNQFLLIHGDTFIQGSPSEGGSFFENIPCWEQYVSTYDSFEQQEFLINPGLSQSQITNLRKEFESLRKLKQLIAAFYKKKCSCADILKHIQHRLNEDGQCVFPISIKGKNNDPGHVLSCVFIKGKQGVECHLLDKGEGSVLHPIVDAVDEKIKRSYRFPPIILNEEMLDSQAVGAISWMSRLLKYGEQGPAIEQEHYQTKEIYAYFLSVANQVSSEFPVVQTAVTAQRAGTCSMQAFNLLFLFDLEMHSPSLVDISEKKKRALFAFRYYSLLNSIHTFTKDNSFQDDAQLRTEFRMAIQGLSLSCDKLYPSILTDHELFLCCCLVEFAEEKLQKIENSLPLQRDEFKTKIPHSTIFEGMFGDSTINWAKKVKILLFRQNPSIDFSQGIVFAHNLCQVLQHSREELDQKELGIDDHPFVYQLLNWLPCPTHQTGDYWDMIPESDISLCIEVIHNLVSRARQQGGNDMQNIFITYIGYAIIHKLCMRLPQLKCAGWGMITYFHVFEQNPNFFIAHGKERKKYQELKTYFNGISCERGELFSYLGRQHQNCISIEDGDTHVRDFDRGEHSRIPKEYLGLFSYLKGFTPNRQKTGEHFSSTPQLYASTWQKGLPKEFYSLQYMAGLSRLTSIKEHPLAELRVWCPNNKDKILFALVWYCKDSKTYSDSDNFGNRHTHSDIEWWQLASGSIELPGEQESNGHENDLSTDVLRKNKMRNYTFYPEHEIWNSNVIFREIRRLHDKTNPAIALPAALNWMSAHPSLLHLEPIQMEIKKLFLSHRNIDFVISAQPDLIKQMRTILRSAAQMCLENSKTVRAGLFWLNLAYEIETQLLYSTNGNRAECLTHIKDLQERVDQLLIKEEGKDYFYAIHLLKIYLFCHVEEISDEKLIELMSSWVSSRLLAKKVPLKHPAKAFLEKWLVRLEAICNTNSELKAKFLQPVGRYYSFPNDGLVEWSDGFPHYEYQGQGIDIHQTFADERIFDLFLTSFGERTSAWRSDEEDISKLIKFSDNPSNPKIVYRQFPNVFYQGKPFELVRDRVQSEWHIDGKNRRYENLQSLPASLPQLLFHNKTVWLSLSTENRHLIVVDKDYKPLFKIDLDEKEQKIFVKKLNHRHNSTEEMLCNTASLPQAPIPFFQMDACLIWEKEGHITTVEYPILGLSFHVDGGRFYCNSFPNYSLSTIESNRHCPFPILILEKESGEKLFLLSNKNYREEEKGGSPYFTYLEEKVTKQLTSPSSSAMIYLICQFAQAGEYEKAMLYLKSVQSQKIYTAKEWEVVTSLLQEQENPNPQRSAFYLHLTLHLLENEDLMLKSFFDGGNENNDDFWRASAQHYSFILSVLNRIPISLQLTLKQRKTLILKLHKKVPSVFEQYLNLSIEYKLITNQRDLTLNTTEHWLESLPSYRLPINVQQYWDRLKPPTGDGRINLQLDSDKHEKSKLEYAAQAFESNFIRLPEKLHDHFFAYYKYFIELKDPVVRKLDILALSMYIKTAATQSGYVHNVQLGVLLLLIASWPERFPPYEEYKNAQGKSIDHINCFFNSIVECAKKIDVEKWEISFKDLFRPEQHLQILEAPILPKTLESKKKILFVGEVFQKSDMPLQELCNHFYVKNPITRSETFVLQRPDHLTPLAQKTLEQLQQGHEANNQQTLTFYDFKGDSTTLTEKLSKQIENDSNEIARLQLAIEELSNEGFDASDTFTVEQLRKGLKESILFYGKKKELITLHNQLYEAFLYQDGHLLQRENPALSDDKINKIFALMRIYMLTSSRLDQAREAAKLAEKLKTCQQEELLHIHQEIATILAKQRAYNPELAPVLLLYEYASGNILRPEQIDIIKWIYTEKDTNKRTELLLEFQAGGGKTKVLATLLSFIAIQEGKLPVFFSLPALADITNKDLRDSFSRIFRKKMRFLEISIHTKLTVAHLHHIMHQLKKWRKAGYLLYVTPETLHALDLQFKWSCATESEHEKIIPLKNILQFFKTNAIFLIDEPHRNACSTETANIAAGEAEVLKGSEKGIFLICYQLLTGTYDKSKKTSQLQTPDGRYISDILKLNENGQGYTTAKEIDLILSTLARFLTRSPLLNIPEEQQDLVATYLCQKGLSIPKGVAKSDALFLARGLITEILRPTLRMVHGFDYGPSIRTEDEIESPRFQRTPSLAQFENTDISSALCCQGLFQRGLNQKQMKRLLLKMSEGYRLFGGVNYNPNVSPDSCKLIRWQQEVNATNIIALSNLNTEESEQIAALTESIGTHPEVVSTYLTDHLLPQIKIFAMTFQSTASDLVSNSSVSILFSATLGLQEEYPDNTPPALVEEGKTTVSFRDDSAFKAAVIQRACDAPNQKILTMTPKSRQTRQARDIFDKIFDQDTQDEKLISGFIDLGAWNQDFSTAEMAEEFLDTVSEQHLDYDGVIYIRDNSNSLSQEKTMVLILQDKKGVRTSFQLQGSNIPEALAQCNIANHEQLKLLKICAADQYTGTDFYFESNARIAITLDQTTTLFSLIQTIMRARQFLKPLINTHSIHRQRIIWIIPTVLQEKITGIYQDLTVETILMWALEQEADQDHMEQRIIASAFQSIEQVFVAWLWQKIFQATSQEEILFLYRQHQVLFNKNVFRDLETLYGHSNMPEKTAGVLNDFANAICTQANISLNQWQLSFEHTKIQSIIERTAQIVPYISQKATSTATAYTHNVEQQKAVEHQNQHVHTKILKHNRNTVAISGRRKATRPKDYANNSHAIGSTHLSNPRADDPFVVSVNRYYDTHLFYENFYLLHNAVKTYEDAQNFQLKPINFVLLVLTKDGDQERRNIFACSNTDANIFYAQLLKPSSLQCSYQCMLFTTEGILAANGEEALAVSEHWLKENEDWIKGILTQVAFCNGQVSNGEVLQHQIKTWQNNDDGEALAKLWDAIQQKQINSETIQVKLIEHLMITAKLEKQTSTKNRDEGHEGGQERPKGPVNHIPKGSANDPRSDPQLLNLVRLDAQANESPPDNWQKFNEFTHITASTHNVLPNKRDDKIGKMLLIASGIVFLLTAGGSTLFIFYPMGGVVIMKPLTVSFIATASSGLFLTITLLAMGCIIRHKHGC